LFAIVSARPVGERSGSTLSHILNKRSPVSCTTSSRSHVGTHLRRRDASTRAASSGHLLSNDGRSGSTFARSTSAPFLVLEFSSTRYYSLGLIR
jgi:hypothetical protein